MIGGGLTSRIVDCYAAIISVWQPGDRIYLFGFSRGAYTVRCVAHVLELVGIPTKASGEPLSLEPTALRGVAKAGVKTMYALGLPVKNLDKRRRNLEAFRAKYDCVIGAGTGAMPYFVGIWDTVAALGWRHFAVSALIRKLPFLSANYDMHFVPDIPFARHAMAIDEYRRDFVRVPWGGSGTVPDGDIAGVTRFRQVWFAGNHSDIGGSYPENELRLSDIALKWMADFISKEIPDETARISINEDFLKVSPSYDGMMHDELMVGHGPAQEIHFWAAGERKVDPNGELHETVLSRLGLASVRNYVGYGPYRAKSLADTQSNRFIKTKRLQEMRTDPSSILSLTLFHSRSKVIRPSVNAAFIARRHLRFGHKRNRLSVFRLQKSDVSSLRRRALDNNNHGTSSISQ